jgi:hypothetical protein
MLNEVSRGQERLFSFLESYLRPSSRGMASYKLERPELGSRPAVHLVLVRNQRLALTDTQ